MQDAELKSRRTRLSTQRRVIDERVAAWGRDAEIVEWMRKNDDPEPALADSEEIINPDKRQENYAN
jgi:hypothetical protein